MQDTSQIFSGVFSSNQQTRPNTQYRSEWESMKNDQKVNILDERARAKINDKSNNRRRCGSSMFSNESVIQANEFLFQQQQQLPQTMITQRPINHQFNDIQISTRQKRPERFISLSVRHSPRLQVTEQHLHRVEIDMKTLTDRMMLQEKEINQLQDLNRKLVNELENYRYKDTLKEAEYVLDHQYNEMLVPQKYKYLFENKLKYLQSIKFNFFKEKGEIETSYKNQINELKLSYSEEVEDLYEIVSELNRQLKETSILKDDAEAQLELTLQDCEERINVFRSEYIVEKEARQRIEDQFNLRVAEVLEINEKYQELDGKHQILVTENTEAQQKLKQAQKEVLNYQKLYNDVDLNAFHKKLCLLTTENEYLKSNNSFISQKFDKIQAKYLHLLAMIKKEKPFSQSSDEEDFTTELRDQFNNVFQAHDDNMTAEDQQNQLHRKKSMEIRNEGVMRVDFEAQLMKSNNSLFTKF